MPSLRALERFLGAAERAIALLDRCRPRNGSSEMARLTEAFARSGAMTVDFEYDRPPDLGEFRRRLEAIVGGAPWETPFFSLYRDRAEELLLEARIVEAIGTDSFERFARARFSVDETDDGRRADALSEEWAKLVDVSSEDIVRSDDERDPRSLVSALRREIGSRRIPVRIVVRHDMASSAAAGDGVVYVRGSAWHTEGEARRIALHEILGHVLPRINARTDRYGILRVGTRYAAEAEEGRALLLEERAGYFGIARRREIAFRHIAARTVCSGANFVETAELLRGHGVSDVQAIAWSARVHRGGGLAREAVYLPSFVRVGRRFAESPGLERWFERGRVSADAAEFLIAHERRASDGVHGRASVVL